MPEGNNLLPFDLLDYNIPCKQIRALKTLNLENNQNSIHYSYLFLLPYTALTDQLNSTGQLVARKDINITTHPSDWCKTWILNIEPFQDFLTTLKHSIWTI